MFAISSTRVQKISKRFPEVTPPIINSDGNNTLLKLAEVK